MLLHAVIQEAVFGLVFGVMLYLLSGPQRRISQLPLPRMLLRLFLALFVADFIVMLAMDFANIPYVYVSLLSHAPIAVKIVAPLSWAIGCLIAYHGLQRLFHKNHKNTSPSS